MIQINLKRLVGQRVFIQFKKGASMYLAARSGGGVIDVAPADPQASRPLAPVESYTFQVEERERKAVLLYENPLNPSEMLAIHHLPVELVAFATVVDNPTATAPAPAPQQE